MSDWRQTHVPPMKAVEKGRRLAPEYECALVDIDMTTSEWTHICPCRFGEPRKSDLGLTWSGDSYRYDIFAIDVPIKQIAIRWSNGGGDGWLLDSLLNRRDEEHLLQMIANVGNETRRWDYCHKLYKTAHMSAEAAARTERSRIFAAYCAGKLKKRKGNNMYYMEILP